MIKLQRALAAKLRERRVKIDAPDAHTLHLRDVPIHGESFSKSHTNVLIKRPREGMPFLVFVDRDLRYVAGKDPALAAAFAGGPIREGWRILFLGRQNDLHTALSIALAALGFGDQEPQAPPAAAAEAATPEAHEGLLAAFATNHTQLVREPAHRPTIGREDQIAEVIAHALRWNQERLVLIVGESGVGKSNLIGGTARQLAQCRPSMEVLSVNLAQVFAGTWIDAERENLVRQLLRDAAAPDQLVAIENLHLALATPCGALLIAESLDAGTRLLGTALPRHLPRFQPDPLRRRLHVVELLPPTASETLAIVQALREPIATHHRVQIDESSMAACVKAAAPLGGHFPAKAIALLDAAAAAAALAGAPHLALDDLCLAASRMAASQELTSS